MGGRRLERQHRGKVEGEPFRQRFLLAATNEHENADNADTADFHRFLAFSQRPLFDLRHQRSIFEAVSAYSPKIASIAASSSSSKLRFCKAITLSSIWLTRLAPIKAEVMPGCRNTQAMAICAML